MYSTACARKVSARARASRHAFFDSSMARSSPSVIVALQRFDAWPGKILAQNATTRPPFRIRNNCIHVEPPPSRFSFARAVSFSEPNDCLCIYVRPKSLCHKAVGKTALGAAPDPLCRRLVSIPELGLLAGLLRCIGDFSHSQPADRVTLCYYCRAGEKRVHRA